MTKVSDYIISFLEEKKLKHIFMLPGGGAMHLNDSLGKSKKIEYFCNLNEQSVAVAAEAYSKYTGEFGCAMVTSGPGATNTITGVNSCWADSVPVFFLSGQVQRKDLISETGLRMGGYQESDISNLVAPITKYAITIKDPSKTRYHLEKAFHLMTEGRPGPVWIDVPFDVQNQEIDVQNIESFQKKPKNLEKIANTEFEEKVEETIGLIKKAKRPVFLAGNGIRLGGGMDEFYKFLANTNIPILTTWGAIDFVEENHPQYFGRPNILGGNRAAGFIMQNSDVLLTVGARLGTQTIGYLSQAFARKTKHIMVDVDKKELDKSFLNPYLKIESDAKKFLEKANLKLNGKLGHKKEWVDWCKDKKKRYVPGNPALSEKKGEINMYNFLNSLSDQLSEGDIISPSSSGSSYVCTSQAIRIKKGQRFLTARGMASMGWDLPSSIGACIAGDKKRTICVTGDGSIQMNLQELETIKANKLPIKIFVFNNGGFLTIKNTQEKYFKGNLVGCNQNSSLHLPNLEKIALAHGIPSVTIKEDSEIERGIEKTLNQKGPAFCQIFTDPNQEIIPKLVAKRGSGGKMIPFPIEDLYPFLPREEFEANMIIEPFEKKK
jgi:acetolactate synthase I/II/III large subunit